MNIGNYEQYESKNTIDLDKDMNSIIIPKQDEYVPQKNNINLEEGMENIEKIDSNKGDNIKKEEENPKGEEIRSSNFDTLDESIKDTLKRDFMRVMHKLEHVLLPRFSASRGKELQNWDLWGPLLFCLILCITIAYTKEDIDSDSRGNVFIIIFIVVWIGGLIISLNSQFLGAPINFFQTLCLLGYCIFPIDVAALVIRLISAEKFVKIIILGVAFLWSCLSSVGFISGIVQPDKKMIAVYPVFLFYLALSWFVLTL